ncbi:MAG: thioredoxin [Oligoflexia bacterium]|nr:thioredoxin [Oligoflexia bacterium]MBF0365157.1 thioredoxin [Oligoflexia bacterium]
MSENRKMIQEINSKIFADIIGETSNIPVVIDFWAPWCGPCKQLTPVLEQLAREHEGKIKIVKLNVDENPGLAEKYGIRGIPTVKIWKAGEEVHSSAGAYPKDYWDEIMAKILQ